MHFKSETKSNDVVERLFSVGDIDGVLWSPADAGHHPLVLLAHGGGQDKMATNLVSRARRYVSACGFAVVAIDAPGHGDRTRTDADDRFAVEVGERIRAGEPVGALIAHYNDELSQRAIPEWQATLDELQQLEAIGSGSVGFWGVSLGSAIGVRLVAAEPRITAAVLGLVGYEGLESVSATITRPLEFLLQWDDELVPRESALALFDAFASSEKTLHANPGRHREVPAFEVASSERFFARHLERVPR